jgi:TonB family protein
MRRLASCLAVALALAGPVLAQEGETVYEPGNGADLPKVVKWVRAQYTADSMRRRVKGAVLLQCVVNREGMPTRVEVIQHLDDDIDKEAVHALQQWRFEPRTKDGKPVSVRIQVKMAFTMKR